MLVTKVARVYAKALLDLALEQGSQDEVKSDLNAVKVLMEESREFRAMLKSPVIKADHKMKILREIFSDKVSEITLHFLLLVSKQGREASLPAMVEAYINIYLEYKGIKQATVTSAHPLSEADLEKVKAKMTEAAGSEIDLKTRVKPDLIGGLILRLGDMQYNGSVASDLKRLRRDFSKNLYVADF